MWDFLFDLSVILSVIALVACIGWIVFSFRRAIGYAIAVGGLFVASAPLGMAFDWLMIFLILLSAMLIGSIMWALCYGYALLTKNEERMAFHRHRVPYWAVSYACLTVGAVLGHVFPLGNK